MTQKTKKNKTYISPNGAFNWPKLREPDFGTEDYPKEGGEFSVKLLLSEPDTAQLQALLADAVDGAMADAKKLDAKRKPAARKKSPLNFNELGTELYDDDENPTGSYEFNFKAKASGISKKTGKKWERTVPVYDSKKKMIPDDVAIWSGSVGKVAFSAIPYFVSANGMAGLSLRLEAVQVIELNSSGNRDASSFGFDEEDGFEVEDEVETASFDEAKTGAGTTEDDSEADF